MGWESGQEDWGCFEMKLVERKLRSGGRDGR